MVGKSPTTAMRRHKQKQGFLKKKFLFFEIIKTSRQPRPIKKPWYLLPKQRANENPNKIRKKFSFLLFSKFNLMIHKPTNVIPKLSGPSGTTKKPPEKK